MIKWLLQAVGLSGSTRPGALLGGRLYAERSLLNLICYNACATVGQLRCVCAPGHRFHACVCRARVRSLSVACVRARACLGSSVAFRKWSGMFYIYIGIDSSGSGRLSTRCVVPKSHVRANATIHRTKWQCEKTLVIEIQAGFWPVLRLYFSCYHGQKNF